MTTKDRLIDALRATREFEESPDLWGRVVHSIEEDASHRRRVLAAAVIVLLTVTVACALAILSVESASGVQMRYRIDWRVVEALEFVLLVMLVAVLGPGIRRFGRGYIDDVFAPSTATGRRLLPLLDIAYYLLFGGYILATTRLAAPVAYNAYVVFGQIGEAAIRIGGLLLIMGVLHAVTLMVMPVVGLVFNTTRVGAKLPRWVTILLIIGGGWLLLQLPGGLALLMVSLGQ